MKKKVYSQAWKFDRNKRLETVEAFTKYIAHRNVMHSVVKDQNKRRQSATNMMPSNAKNILKQKKNKQANK